MSTTVKFLKASLPFTELEDQAMVITVPIDFKETVSSQISLANLSHTITPSTEIKKSLYSPNASLNDGTENQEASSSSPSTVIRDSKTPQKKLLNLFLQSPRGSHTIF